MGEGQNSTVWPHTSVCAASSSRGSLSESRGDRGHIEECIAIERVILMLTIIEGW